MNLRNTYGNEDIDKLLCYFMKTILRIWKNGAAHIPLDVTFDEPVNAYLKIAVDLMENAQPLEMTQLILKIEYENITLEHALTKAQITLLVLINELSTHIRLDEDMTDYLLSTENMWNNMATAYATKTFFCNMPLEIQKRNGVDAILKSIPDAFLERDNF